MIYIGIDPDVDKSGVAYYNNKTKDLELSNLTFFQLFDYLRWSRRSNLNLKVILESGWLNKKSNWHDEKSGARVASYIGKNTGRNHETGRKIEEMLIYLKIDYELKTPKTSKVNTIMFNKITGILSKTNQDQRDAAMLVWGL